MPLAAVSAGVPVHLLAALRQRGERRVAGERDAPRIAQLLPLGPVVAELATIGRRVQDALVAVRELGEFAHVPDHLPWVTNPCWPHPPSDVSQNSDGRSVNGSRCVTCQVALFAGDTMCRGTL